MDKFLFGICVGIVIMIALLENMPGSLVKKANEAIQECEKSLPRDQHCKITAIAIPVPKE